MLSAQSDFSSVAMFYSCRVRMVLVGAVTNFVVLELVQGLSDRVIQAV